MKAILARNADTVFGVFGYLTLYADTGSVIDRWCSCEDDWLGNVVGRSCIPAGGYVCRRSVWHKTGTVTFEITGVPNRARILFHPGNTEEDVEGCVLLGEDFGALTVPDEDSTIHEPRVKWAIVRSRPAFNDFMARLHGVDQFPLSVEWIAPGAWRVS